MLKGEECLYFFDTLIFYYIFPLDQNWNRNFRHGSADFLSFLLVPYPYILFIFLCLFQNNQKSETSFHLFPLYFSRNIKARNQDFLPQFFHNRSAYSQNSIFECWKVNCAWISLCFFDKRC